MNTTAAAAQAHVTVATIRTWCRIGAITAIKQAGRWIIDTTSLTQRIAIGHLKTHKTSKAVVYSIETMTAIGGNRWQKAGMDRVYLNDWIQLAGIEITRYNTGNISTFAIGGRGIANSRAGRILGTVSKVYFDATDGHLYVKHSGARAVEVRYLDGERDTIDLVASINTGVRAAIAAL